MHRSEREFCQCGKPEKWAQHPAFPVEFNAKLNEYHLVFGDWVNIADPDLYDTKKWEKCYRYSSRWKTLVLDVLESSDGSDHWFWFGQFVGASNECRCADKPGNKPW